MSRLAEKQPPLVNWTSQLLHNDNARAHSEQTTATLQELQIENHRHTSYQLVLVAIEILLKEFGQYLKITVFWFWRVRILEKSQALADGYRSSAPQI